MLRRRRTWLWLGLVGLLLLAAGLAIALRVRGRAATLAQSGEIVTAFIGDLAESASASGQLVARREADLSLVRSGTVSEVLVNMGDVVAAGNLLVRLDDAALRRGVATAEQDVIIAQANLDALFAGPTAAQVGAAEANVASAAANLADLAAGPTPEEIAASEASIRAAEANLLAAQRRLQGSFSVAAEADILAAEEALVEAQEQRQAAHDIWVRVADCEADGQGGYHCTLPDSDLATTVSLNLQAAEANLASAQARLDSLRQPGASGVAAAEAGVASAQAQLDAAEAAHETLLLGASAAEIAAAAAELANAEATLATLLSPPSTAAVAINETRLAQAQSGLANAQRALAEASLVAPFAGVVTAVWVAPGELATGLAVTLVDTASLELVLNVDEVDIGLLAIGQEAAVTLESFPEQRLASEIVAIAPIAETAADGIVTFAVRLGLAPSELPLRVGMTANAALITASREDVLLVPNAAITADRSRGEFFVNRLVGEDENGAPQFEQVEVTIGLRDDRYAHVVSGLRAGDQVVLGQLAAPVFQFGDGPPPFADD